MWASGLVGIWASQFLAKTTLHLHDQKKIIHRDIKLDNIIIKEEKANEQKIQEILQELEKSRDSYLFKTKLHFIDGIPLPTHRLGQKRKLPPPIDLKYLKENLEITNPKVHFSRIISVKIIDLGFAKEFSNLPKIKNNKHIPDVAGSYCFKAPELLSKPLYYYNEKIDIWCLGLVLKLLMARCESLFNYKDISDKVAADKEKGIVVKDVSKYMKKVVTEKIKRKDFDANRKFSERIFREKNLKGVDVYIGRIYDGAMRGVGE